jgi:hypothetical protein
MMTMLFRTLVPQLAGQYGRHGYRRITGLLKRAGWQVGKGRVERIRHREGLKVPQEQEPKGRLWRKRPVLAACTESTVGMTMSAWWELS